MGTQELLINHDTIELRYLEQLIDREQTMALGYLLKHLQLHSMNGRKSMEELLSFLENELDQHGLEGLFLGQKVRDFLARPRKIEIAACINRYRKLLFPKE